MFEWIKQSPSVSPKTIPATLKWHGGKHYLADWIISLMPPHQHDPEPFIASNAHPSHDIPFCIRPNRRLRFSLNTQWANPAGAASSE